MAVIIGKPHNPFRQSITKSANPAQLDQSSQPSKIIPVTAGPVVGVSNGPVVAVAKQFFIPGDSFGAVNTKTWTQRREVGYPGLHVYSGYVAEDYIAQLQGYRGVQWYEEMRRNDPVVASMLLVAEQLIHNAQLMILPSEINPTAQKSKMAAELVRTSLYDMGNTWTDTLSEILTFLAFGWAVLSVWFRQRKGYNRDKWKSSRYTDNKWGFAGISLRSQKTLNSWETDDKGRAIGMWQQGPPNYELVYIPLGLCGHFRTRTEADNPEGIALTLDTPINTPDGWKTMGTIQVGDKVFGADGRIRYVVAKSEIWRDRPCYEITFSSRDSVVADENHLWVVSTPNYRKGGKPSRVIATKELYRRLSEFGHNCNNTFSVGRVPVLDYPAQILPMDPYVLGYWLGDGNTLSGEITVDAQDQDSLKKEVLRVGLSVRFHDEKRAYIHNLRPLLRVAGVFGNKHIPEAYIRGSFEQRLALLQGLMDSDGCSPSGDKPSRFFSTNLPMIKQIEELVVSLGCIPRLTLHTKGDGKVRSVSKEGREIVSNKDCYMLSFWAPFSVHRLPRKAAAQTFRQEGITLNHYIKDIKPVDRRDTVCIETDAPDHLYIVGKKSIPTHNSVLRSAFRAYYLKKQLEEAEATGIQRDVTGALVLTVPEGVNIWNPNDPAAAATLARAENIVRTAALDKYMGAVLPHGWELKNITTPGQRPHNSDTVIARWDQRIAVTMLADMLLIGHEKVGSFALMQSKTKIFSSALESYAARIAGVFNNELIPRMMLINGIPEEYWPLMKFGPVETPSLIDLAKLLESMSKVGIPLDEGIALYTRQVAGFPPKKEGDEEIEPPKPEPKEPFGGEPAEENPPTKEPEEEPQGNDSETSPTKSVKGLIIGNDPISRYSVGLDK